MTRLGRSGAGRGEWTIKLSLSGSLQPCVLPRELAAPDRPGRSPAGAANTTADAYCTAATVSWPPGSILAMRTPASKPASSTARSTPRTTFRLVSRGRVRGVCRVRASANGSPRLRTARDSTTSIDRDTVRSRRRLRREEGDTRSAPDNMRCTGLAGRPRWAGRRRVGADAVIAAHR